MPTPDQIIKGEIVYTLDELYNEVKAFVHEIPGIDQQKKEKGFHTFFMFIMLSGENKPIEMLMELFNFTKEQITDQHETFKEYIDVCRAIHMKKFLDIYVEYMAGTTMTLQMLNLWIQEFLKKYIKEENHDTT